MNRKLQHLYIYLCFSVICLLVTDSFINTNEQVIAPAPTASQHYILKEYSGKLAVFSDGEDTPEEILDIYVSVFPDTDKKKLAKGIYAYSREELQSLLEDFSG